MLRRNKCKDVQSDVLFKHYGNRRCYGFNPWEDSSWQRVHCPWAANRVKERLEYSDGRKGTERVQIIRIYTSFPPLPVLQLLKFPMLKHLEIPELFSNLSYLGRSLVQTNPKTETSCQKQILTTFIRFSWSPFWFLAFFSLNEKGTWIFTTNYANIQMPIIHRPYTPTGNRTTIHNNIENGTTENYYRNWYALCVKTQLRQNGDKHNWRGATNTQNPSSHSV